MVNSEPHTAQNVKSKGKYLNFIFKRWPMSTYRKNVRMFSHLRTAGLSLNRQQITLPSFLNTIPSLTQGNVNRYLNILFRYLIRPGPRPQYQQALFPITMFIHCLPVRADYIWTNLIARGPIQTTSDTLWNL